MDSLQLGRFSLFGAIGNTAQTVGYLGNKMALGSAQERQFGEIPCFFPAKQGKQPEAGSPWTASTAKNPPKPLILRA
jgi:hypothetical protein